MMAVLVTSVFAIHRSKSHAKFRLGIPKSGCGVIRLETLLEPRAYFPYNYRIQKTTMIEFRGYFDISFKAPYWGFFIFQDMK